MLRWAAFVALAMLAIVLGVGSAGAQGSKGADFWLTFPSNYTGGGTLTLFIAGETGTTGTVSIPGGEFSANFTLTSGSVSSVQLPSGAEIRASNAAADNGIHVHASAPVTVYGLDELLHSTDGYLALPTDALGTDYIALGYGGENQADPSELAVVGTEDGTTVTITPSTTLSGQHPAGATFEVALDQGQTYQLQGRDVSGTLISSDKAISVFAGSECADVPAMPLTFSCNHLVEQLPPTSEWGRHFVSMPLATRDGDTFRILASQDNTTVQLNGAAIATLNRGQFTEQQVTDPAWIVADKPVLVMQYSNGTSFDGVAAADPSQTMIPPYEQFVDSYTVTTPPAAPFASNYLNVIAPNDAVDGGILLDDEPISSEAFTAIGGSGFSGAQVSVTPGSHTLSGSSAFGVQSYGFAEADSYGYPGGFAIRGVASVTLGPKTGAGQVNTAQCVTATVTDGSQPLQEISVHFVATGANTADGFGFTNASGQAQFCYSGAHAGTDTVTGTAGAFSDTATRTWTLGPPPGTPAKSDVAVALTVPQSVRVGQAVTFTAKLSNGGVDSATGVVLHLPVPAGSTFKSGTVSAPNTCTATTSTVTCNVGTLTPGGSALVTVALTANQLGPLTASASAVADWDTNPANNSSSATTTVLSLTAPPLPPPPPTDPGTFNAIGVGAVDVNGVNQAPDQVFTLNSGNTIDVSQGAVTLTASDGSFASFSSVQVTSARSLSARSASGATAVSSKFKITSGAVTVLTLVGGNFAVCNTPRSLTATNTTPVRQLWGSAKGNFQTKSRYSSATVRGTIWFTQDRCDGSLTSVVQGVVDVLDTSLNKTFAVGPGQSHLALKKSFKPPTVKKKAKKKATVQTAAVYTVRAGDSLWAIAAAKLGSGGRWTEIVRLNQLRPPYAIPAGTRLKLPRR